MPHWTNLSFYTTNKKNPYTNFVPRIKLPPSFNEDELKKSTDSLKRDLISEDECIHNSFFDYDAYDAAIFHLSSVQHLQESTYVALKIQFYWSLTTYIGIRALQARPPPRYKRSSGSLLDSQEVLKGSRRKMSDPDLSHHLRKDNGRSEPIAIPSASTNPLASPHTEGLCKL